MGLTELTLGENSASGLLPQDRSLQRANGAICRQAIMAAIDTIVALVISTGEKVSKGTARPNTQFLRSAIGEDLRIASNVIKFGRTIAYAETHIFLLSQAS
jgi:acyl-coenzyme A thioesterase PaaI-like protein